MDYLPYRRQHAIDRRQDATVTQVGSYIPVARNLFSSKAQGFKPMISKSLYLVLLLIALRYCPELAAQIQSEYQSERPPNIVLIFTDDQGYGDLSCFGGKHVSTPRIDQMAAEGSRLTSFYVAASVCTPSRAGLMTGCYPPRVGMGKGSKSGVLLAADPKGLNPSEITIPEVLKTAGYKTGMFGKWHLGDQPEFLPTRQGFDVFFGIPYSHDIHPLHPKQKRHHFPSLPLLDGETVIEMDPDADFLTKRFTEHAVEFIEQNKNQPFFVYLPHPIPHSPLHVSPEFMKDASSKTLQSIKNEGNNSIDFKAREGLFRQAIAEIDWSVGQILDTLKKNGLDDNTLVIFTSDNGPGLYRRGSPEHAAPLSGGKGSTLEGGMREPTVVRWPGHIPAGKDNDELMTAMDLLPTFAKLAGAEIPADRTIDGKDISGVLTGQQKSPHEAFFYHRANTLEAVRSGKWKLRLAKAKKGEKETTAGAKNSNAMIAKALFDLDADIGEKNNVIADHPEVAERLLNLAKTFHQELSENIRPAAFVKNPQALTK